MPPFVVPPLSCAVTVTVATPNAFGAGWNDSSSPSIVGCTLKSAPSGVVTATPTDWPDSFGGPATRLVRKPGMVVRGASSATL